MQYPSVWYLAIFVNPEIVYLLTAYSVGFSNAGHQVIDDSIHRVLVISLALDLLFTCQQRCLEFWHCLCVLAVIHVFECLLVLNRAILCHARHLLTLLRRLARKLGMCAGLEHSYPFFHRVLVR